MTRARAHIAHARAHAHAHARARVPAARVEPEASYKGARNAAYTNKVYPPPGAATEGLGPRGASRKIDKSADSGIEEGLQRAKDGRVHPQDIAKNRRGFFPSWNSFASTKPNSFDSTTSSSSLPRLRSFSSTRTRQVHPSSRQHSDLDVESRRRCAVWKRKVFRFGAWQIWSERLWLCTERLQLFEVIWICSQNWPWPPLWLHWTRRIVFMNLDFAAWGATGAGLGSTGALDRSVYGHMPDFIYFMVTPLVLGGLFLLLLDALLRSDRMERLAHLRDVRHDRTRYSRARVFFASAATRAATLLYVPICLVMCRLCRCDNEVFASDPEQLECDSFELFIDRAMFLPLGLFFLLYLPLTLRWRATAACSFSMDLDHEKHLQIREIEHVVGVDAGDSGSLLFEDEDPSLQNLQADHAQTGRAASDWRDSDVWIVAPFQRRAANYESTALLRKFFVSLCFLPNFDTRPRTQGLCLLTVLGYFGTSSLPPYRSWQSNAMHVVSDLVLIMNAIYAMLTAWGLRDAFVMPKQQTLGLITINFLAFLGVLSIALRSLCSETPPACQSLGRMVDHHGSENVASWLDCARSARAATIRCRAWRPVECAPIDKLEMWAGRLRCLWLEAKRRDCLLETTLRESLEELLLTHQLIAKSALALGGDWLANNDPFAGDVITHLRSRYDQNKLLMRPLKRRLLTKLAVSRQLSKLPRHSRGLERAADADIRLFPFDEERRESGASGFFNPFDDDLEGEPLLREDDDGGLVEPTEPSTSRSTGSAGDDGDLGVDHHPSYNYSAAGTVVKGEGGDQQQPSTYSGADLADPEEHPSYSSAAGTTIRSDGRDPVVGQQQPSTYSGADLADPQSPSYSSGAGTIRTGGGGPVVGQQQPSTYSSRADLGDPQSPTYSSCGGTVVRTVGGLVGQQQPSSRADLGDPQSPSYSGRARARGIVRNESRVDRLQQPSTFSSGSPGSSASRRDHADLAEPEHPRYSSGDIVTRDGDFADLSVSDRSSLDGSAGVAFSRSSVDSSGDAASRRSRDYGDHLADPQHPSYSGGAGVIVKSDGGDVEQPDSGAAASKRRGYGDLGNDPEHPTYSARGGIVKSDVEQPPTDSSGAALRSRDYGDLGNDPDHPTYSSGAGTIVKSDVEQTPTDSSDAAAKRREYGDLARPQHPTYSSGAGTIVKSDVEQPPTDSSLDAAASKRRDYGDLASPQHPTYSSGAGTIVKSDVGDVEQLDRSGDADAAATKRRDYGDIPADPQHPSYSSSAVVVTKDEVEEPLQPPIYSSVQETPSSRSVTEPPPQTDDDAPLPLHSPTDPPLTAL